MFGNGFRERNMLRTGRSVLRIAEHRQKCESYDSDLVDLEAEWSAIGNNEC
jgi:hypothetical protein